MPSTGRQYLWAGIVLAALGTVLTAGEWQCDGHWLWFRGQPILLIGDSITQGWMELGTDFDQRAYLDALARRGINVVLLWSYIGIVDQASDARVGYDAPEIWPWLRVNGKFDLTRFNAAYFDRLHELIRLAAANNIVVVIQVHDGWTKTTFAGHPFNVANGGPLTDKAQFVELSDDEHEMPPVFDPAWTRLQKHQFYLERFCERFLQATADTPDVTFRLRWYDPRRGQFHDAGRIRGGSEAQPFVPPFPGDAVLHLKALGSAP